MSGPQCLAMLHMSLLQPSNTLRYKREPDKKSDYGKKKQNDNAGRKLGLFFTTGTDSMLDIPNRKKFDGTLFLTY